MLHTLDYAHDDDLTLSIIPTVAIPRSILEKTIGSYEGSNNKFRVTSLELFRLYVCYVVSGKKGPPGMKGADSWVPKDLLGPLPMPINFFAIMDLLVRTDWRGRIRGEIIVNTGDEPETSLELRHLRHFLCRG